jgi:hypothetical protein
LTSQADRSSTVTNGYSVPTPQSAPTLPPDPPHGSAPVARSAAARRRTSRRALIVSVLLVLLGGVLAYGGSTVLTRHTSVLAVARDVPVGGTIRDADLTVANVSSDPSLSPIPAGQRAEVIGLVARVALVRGELLTRAQVGRGSGFSVGQQLVALPLKQGQFPARGLDAGQTVLIMATPGSNGPAVGSPSSAAVGGAAAKGISATVAEVGSMNPATQVTVIDVRVTAADGPAVARVASTGNLALILLPAGR